MKSYLFVIRAYNDVDHFTPLLDYYCRKGLVKVHLFSAVHPSAFSNNECIKYLKVQHGLQVRYLLEGVGVGFTRWFDGLLRKTVSFVRARSLPQKIRNPLGDFLTLGFNFVAWRYKKIGDVWARKILDECNPEIIIYDWADPGKFPWKPLTKLGRKRKIPIVALPHGINCYLDEFPAGGRDKHVAWNQGLANQNMNFDFHVTQGALGAMHMKSQGIDPKKIKVLGSLRYDPEWLSQYSKINQDQTYNWDNANSFKILIFASKLHYKAYVEEIRDLIRSTIGPNRCVVVKPHTRGMLLDFLKGHLPEGNIRFEPNKSSYQLLRWCDVAIVWGSSIGLQVLYEEKPLIYPQYVHKPSTIFGKYLPESQVNSTEELNSVLNSLQNGTNNCYTSEQVNDLFKDVVYGGDSDTSVVERHAIFFESLIKS